MDVDVIPACELPGHCTLDRGVGVLDAAERLVREDHAEPEGVVGGIALPHGDLVARVELLGKCREVQPARSAPDNRNSHVSLSATVKCGVVSVPASIHFADLTSPRARALLDAGPAPVLLLPIGAVEPHGPHAPLGTDSIISTAICERAAGALSGDRAVRALVLPEIAFGVTRYAAAFTGAVTISEATLHAMVVEVCASLRAQGFRHQVIVNSHFEPAQVETLRRAAG